MISIRRETDYAARIVLHLSTLEEGAQITAHEVAEQRMLPRPFMRRIIGRMSAAGILRTTKGAKGGIALARPAASISLLDIVTAMEGPPSLNLCVDDSLACPFTTDCHVRQAWAKVSELIAGSLGSIRFDHLAKASSDQQSEQPIKKKKGNSHGRD
jgi:Rrf2 family protein